MPKKILLFDFDGTLADTADSVIKRYNEIAAENNYKLITKDNLHDLRNRSAMENFRDSGIPFYKIPFIVARVQRAMKADIPNLKAMEGIRQPLLDLKAKGCEMYIVSSNSEGNISSFLSNNGLDEFNKIYSVSNLFGKDAQIRKLIKSNGWKAEDVAYIGDEVRDIEAAKRAGVKSVSAAWGYNTKEVLAKNHPDLLLEDPSQLTSLA